MRVITAAEAVRSYLRVDKIFIEVFFFYVYSNVVRG